MRRPAGSGNGGPVAKGALSSTRASSCGSRRCATCRDANPAPPALGCWTPTNGRFCRCGRKCGRGSGQHVGANVAELALEVLFLQSPVDRSLAQAAIARRGLDRRSASQCEQEGIFGFFSRRLGHGSPHNASRYSAALFRRTAGATGRKAAPAEISGIPGKDGWMSSRTRGN